MAPDTVQFPRLVLWTAAALVIPHADAARWNFHHRHPSKPRASTRTVVVPAPVPAPLPVPARDPAADREAAQAQAEAAQSIAALQDRTNRKNSEGAEQRVLEHLRKRTEDGSADAPYDLAKRHEDGVGVPKNAAEAARLYRLSAERGNADAKRWLERQADASRPIETK
ncbi:MAG: sel1 repeat family protein [Verrucomicrobia bacterium]|nr:MAG: sel1 repeat family protein [Verrucomicrobiota bacterium]